MHRIIRNSYLILPIFIFFFNNALSAYAESDDWRSLKKPPIKVDFNDVSQQNPPSALPDGDSLKIAVAAMISPQYTHKYYIELLNLIGEQMKKKVHLVQKKTYSEVNRMLQEQKIDLAFVCSGPYVAGKEEYGMEIVAVPVCHGEKVYYSYFIVSKKSGISSWGQLRKKVFAFTDPLSNSGCLVPTYYLAMMDETPESYFKRTFFTHSHDNSIQAVSEGLADGAAVDSLIYDFFKSQQPVITENTVVIEKSPPYGIPPVVVHPLTNEKIKEDLRRVFMSIHENGRGRRILDKLQIDRFEEGNDGDYDTVRELAAFLKTYTKQ